MTDKEYDRWVKEQIIDPVIKQWGPGWNRLSTDMKRDALFAAVTRNMLAQARFDTVAQMKDATSADRDAAALGRHTAAVAQAVCRYTAKWED